MGETGPAAWHRVSNADEIPSPALLLHEGRALANIDRAIAMVGDPSRLRPHVKTHKLRELIRAQVARGVSRFKCATIPEAEISASGGAGEVLLAYPMLGPNARRLVELAMAFPNTRFGLTVDCPGALRAITEAVRRTDAPRLDVYIDVDCGMGRTGIVPGGDLLALRRAIEGRPGLRFAGLHAYDGHIHETDPVARASLCDAAFAGVERMREAIAAETRQEVVIVAGGTPTFPIHARRAEVQCAPGTFVLWDFGYADKFPDLGFDVAAVLLTRVLSKPGPGRLCLDLGHKAVASENPHPRVRLMELPDARCVAHSEEHMVVECAGAEAFEVGDCLHAVPRHICPTVALHGEVFVVREGAARETWRVQARERRLAI